MTADTENFAVMQSFPYLSINFQKYRYLWGIGLATDDIIAATGLTESEINKF